MNEKKDEKSYTKTKNKQKELLELLKRFDAFCSRHCIRYFVAYGTCLGAVREKGFISWDGDIDIIIPLPEYEKLENAVNNESEVGFAFVSYKSVQNAPNLMGRIYAKDFNLVNIEKYPYLDLFALCGAPSEEKKQKRFMRSALLNYRIYWVKNRKYLHSLYRRKSIIGILLKLALLFVRKKVCINRFETLMYRFSFDKAKYIAPLTSLYCERDVFLKQWIDEEPVLLDFCDMKVPVIKEYHKYLVLLYGQQYMTPKKFSRYK